MYDNQPLPQPSRGKEQLNEQTLSTVPSHEKRIRVLWTYGLIGTRGSESYIIIVIIMTCQLFYCIMYVLYCNINDTRWIAQKLAEAEDGTVSASTFVHSPFFRVGHPSIVRRW